MSPNDEAHRSDLLKDNRVNEAISSTYFRVWVFTATFSSKSVFVQTRIRPAMTYTARSSEWQLVHRATDATDRITIWLPFNNFAKISLYIYTNRADTVFSNHTRFTVGRYTIFKCTPAIRTKEPALQITLSVDVHSAITLLCMARWRGVVADLCLVHSVVSICTVSSRLVWQTHRTVMCFRYFRFIYLGVCRVGNCVCFRRRDR